MICFCIHYSEIKSDCLIICVISNFICYIIKIFIPATMIRQCIAFYDLLLLFSTPLPPPLIWYSWVFFWHDWVVSVSFTISLITFTVFITIFINIYINSIVKWKECSSIPICTLSWMTLLFLVTFICNQYNFYSFSLISKSLLLSQQIFQFIFDRSWEEKKNSN